MVCIYMLKVSNVGQFQMNNMEIAVLLGILGGVILAIWFIRS